MKIHASSRPKDETTAEAHKWTVETDDYEAGMVEVRAAVPEGWVLLSVMATAEATGPPAAS